MKDTNGSTKQPAAASGGDDAERLKQLRALLLGKEQLELEELREQFSKLAAGLGQLGVELEDLIERLQDPSEMKPAISRVLAEAVEMRDSLDREEDSALGLSEALRPVIERSLHMSVERDASTLAEVIYPSVMPAIRRATQRFFQDLVGQLSMVLDTKLSPKSLRWRLEAAQTGKPFAEVVLMHTLEYRVEQLFLIHRESGLLLLHASGDPEMALDADLVSGMLTAIQDFVRDSFHADSDDVLDTLQLGEMNVLVVTAPRATLAAVVRGVPPPELRRKLQEVLESIHHRHNDQLRTFAGDSSSLESSLPLLSSGLLSRRRDQASDSGGKRGRKVAGWAALGLVLAAVVAWSFFSWKHNREWSRFADRLESEPGIVVVDRGRNMIVGLRDELSINPDVLLSEFDLDPDDVSQSWSSFISTDPVMVERRITTLLRPPAHLSIQIDRGRFTATGRGSAWWIRHVRERALAIPGVLEIGEPEQQPEVDLLARNIEAETFSYGTGQLAIADADQRRFNTLVNRIDSLQQVGRTLGLPVQVEVRGHASPDGPRLVNLQLSQLRADEFRRLLVDALGQRRDPEFLDVVATGMGAADQRTAAETGGGRFVQFRIHLDTAKN